MKSKTRLDSAIFQLTPTRTRCDLYIVANEKKEKIASGLLNPFLAHLKTAQDQIAEGGYSVLLEPESGSDATWFTKGTLERFVRFVSTPEILERVYTIESEILQIEEAVAIQSCKDNGVDDHPAKHVANSEGNKSKSDANEEKAIVLYKPGAAQPPETNGASTKDGNSKAQLLKVLETRKTVLQKEQGMAFARAVAAGFESDHMPSLVSFAECFGASRLMDACLRFTELWKGKHESGQWLEIEATEAMSSKSDFSTMNASGIVLSSMTSKQHESQSELAAEANGKAGIDTSADGMPPMDQQIPVGQFPHPMFPPWPMHPSPGGVPVFPAYPMPGMPYYQNYPGNAPFYQPPYPPMEDSQFNTVHKTGKKRQSMDSRESNYESETMEVDASKIRLHNDVELEDEASHTLGRQKKAGRSGKKQSGMVVIRNINYITSKRQSSSGDESESVYDPESGEETGELLAGMQESNLRSSNKKGNHRKSADDSNLRGKEETDTDGGHWQAFQSCLLRGADEDNRSANEGMFGMERDVQIKRRLNKAGDDPIARAGRDLDEIQDTRINEFHSGNASRILRASHDDAFTTKVQDYYVNGDGRRMDMQSAETNGRKIINRSANDDFIIGRRDHTNVRNSLDPLAENGFEGVTTADSDRTVSHDMVDETYIVPFRSMSIDQATNDDRTAIVMDYELASKSQDLQNMSTKIDNQASFEPHELSLMPERGSEKRSIGYDPALDYEMQFSADKRSKEDLRDVKQGSKDAAKDRKSKVNHDTLDKKKIGGAIRKGKPSKMNPLEDARARAEKLRSFKADLQKMKKEQEDAEHRRLEALKMERQKRIAARCNATTVQSTLPSRKQLPAKLSSISHKGSKFSDSEPGSSSPLQRSKIRNTSLGSVDVKRPSKANKLSDGNQLAGNRLTRSVSSLSDTKKENSGITPDSKASMARIRRLSEPKKISSHSASSVKTRSAEPVPKPKASDGTESKKISAIMNLDRSKAATLPELKIKTSNVGEKGSVAKEMQVKVKEVKSSVTSKAAELNWKNDRLPHQSDMDENPVIEKTVVMLESVKPSIANASEELMGVKKESNDYHETREKNETVDYAAILAAPSPMEGDHIRPISSRLQERPSSFEVRTNSVVKEMPKTSSTNTAEKPYQAPYARVSSLEDPSTRNSEYGKAPQTSFDMLSTGVGTVKVHVSDLNNLKLEKIPEVLDKPQVKEPKGLRRFLKLGKKSHNSAAGDQSNDSDKASVNGGEPDDNAASSEVHTLKNLISQDETPPAGSTSQKSSRHFSLLSPFRMKSSEKKLAS